MKNPKQELIKELQNCLETASDGLIDCAGKSLEALQKLENLESNIIHIYSNMCEYPGALELIDSLAEIHEHVKKEGAKNEKLDNINKAWGKDIPMDKLV